MNRYEKLKADLSEVPATWLVTGVAGFIGSNLLESLLKLDQYVVGLDNFSTGKRSNLEEVASLVSPEQWARFQFIEGDIRSLEDCKRGMLFAGNDERSVDYVLHQAALGSVPRSIADPISTNASNVDGFLNMLVAANYAKVRKFVYAASSSTYGDHPDLPKVEENIGNPLSPYAVTKYVNELYAKVFDRCYGLKSVGLRYFNVFGRRQDPDGAYAAVIPKWVGAIISEEDVFINGDGSTSRDFCYVDNAVQANLLAATYLGACSEVLNVAVGDQTSLLRLYDEIGSELLRYGYRAKAPLFRDFRVGDVMHSLADISKAKNIIGYDPRFRVQDGLKQAIAWYVDDFRRR